MENSEKTVTTRSVGLRFGLIVTVIDIIIFLALVLLGFDAFDKNWGWVRMAISIVILVLAHKNFKDNTDGYMTYGQGVGIGFWILLISIAIGNIFMWLFVSFVDTTAMDMFYQKQMDEMEAKNMPAAQIEMAMTWTKKLFWVIAAVFGLFFGMIVALIVSIFTQKKRPEQTHI